MSAHEVASVCDNFRFAAIEEFANLAESYARSAAEAAWRGDRLTLGVHLAQLRMTTIEAIKSFKELSADAPAEGRAA